MPAKLSYKLKGNHDAACTGELNDCFFNSHAQAVIRSLRDAGIRARRIDVPDGDASKSFRQLSLLYDAFLAQGLDRRSALVALGGGMVGDLTGFAALLIFWIRRAAHLNAQGEAVEKTSGV